MKTRYAVCSILLSVLLIATQPAVPANGPAEGKKVAINLDRAAPVALPAIGQDLKPTAYRTPDGKTGWVVRIPGGRPIATPAYADGMLFVGGGYGSHEFYAFNAETGALVWKIQTGDDGPTAAVVEDGYVAFNTESCTIVVVDEKTGKLVWQEWLGDPLMSQPAIAKDRLFMAYPAGQRGHKATQNSTGPHGTHHLLAVDLKTGRHLWEQEITADVISAPVVSGDTVYLTCFDGTSFALDAATGKVLWTKRESGTGAPVIANGQVVVPGKEKNGNNAFEGLLRLGAGDGKRRDATLLARDKADYLTNGGSVAMSAQAQASLDSSVGFATAPAAGNLGVAKEQVGVSTVVGGWAYQGSRAAYNRGQWLNAQGQNLNAINAATGSVNWRAEVHGAKINGNTQVFSPPALGREYMYLSSAQGHLLSVRQTDGGVGFSYVFPQPMVFQPALARGNVYAGTNSGLLLCLKTGNPDADGWYAWGGNAQHNKN